MGAVYSGQDGPQPDRTAGTDPQTEGGAASGSPILTDKLRMLVTVFSRIPWTLSRNRTGSFSRQLASLGAAPTLRPSPALS